MIGQYNSFCPEAGGAQLRSMGGLADAAEYVPRSMAFWRRSWDFLLISINLLLYLPCRTEDCRPGSRLDQPNDRKVLPGELGYMVSNCRTKCMEEKNKYIPILGTTFPKFLVKGKDLPFGRSLGYFNLLRKLLI